VLNIRDGSAVSMLLRSKFDSFIFRLTVDIMVAILCVFFCSFFVYHEYDFVVNK